MLKVLINKIKMYKNPIKYARGIGVSIGRGCKFITPPNLGSEPWLIEIGNHVELSGYVTLITHDDSTWVFRDEEPYKNVIRYGKIIIHDNCFIGMGCHIMPGVEIGENSIVGAGSVVTKSIPANSVYAGNPARFICTLDDFKKKCLERTPDYDLEEYQKDKQKVVKELLKDKLRF